MRRWAAAIAALAAMAGCADRPAGIDGDLTNGWSPPPAARAFRPTAGTCHADVQQTATAGNWSPVPCTGPHMTETVAVAELAGAAGIKTPSAGTAKAFAECSKRATAFLGADWRTGWVVIEPVLPAKGAWAAGARWTSCDIAETSPVDGKLVRRSGTMKGLVKSGAKLRMACANPTIDGDQVTEMHPVACAATHTAEFAGLFATRARSSSDLNSDQLADGCGATIARFTGLKNDSTIPSRVGWLGFPPDDYAWTMGDRAIRCFLWLNGEKMKGSYRNAGPGKLKVHYTS